MVVEMVVCIISFIGCWVSWLVLLFWLFIEIRRSCYSWSYRIYCLFFYYFCVKNIRVNVWGRYI